MRSRVYNARVWCLSAVISLLLTACGGQPVLKGEPPTLTSNPLILVDEFLLGVDDVVKVSVWKNDDLSIEVPVRPDGKISMPLAGEIMAGGRTTEAVEADITERLARFIRDPEVTVIVTQLNSTLYLSRVRVSGAVRNQISIPHRPGMTVLDIVLEAGGLTEFASGNNAKLIRQSGTQSGIIPIKLQDILNDGDMRTNYAINPGDTLSIPERIF